jgi:hypothetical protein
MVGAGVPLLALHPHSWLRARRDLHHRGNGSRSLELELATDRERQTAPLGVF